MSQENSVRLISSSGAGLNRNVDIVPGSATVGSVLESAGQASTNVRVTVNGAAAELTTAVSAGDRVVVAPTDVKAA